MLKLLCDFAEESAEGNKMLSEKLNATRGKLHNINQDPDDNEHFNNPSYLSRLYKLQR